MPFLKVASLTFLWIVEAQQQVEERGLAAARRPHEAHHGSTGDVEGHLLAEM